MTERKACDLCNNDSDFDGTEFTDVENSRDIVMILIQNRKYIEKKREENKDLSSCSVVECYMAESLLGLLYTWGHRGNSNRLGASSNKYTEEGALELESLLREKKYNTYVLDIPSLNPYITHTFPIKRKTLLEFKQCTLVEENKEEVFEDEDYLTHLPVYVEQMPMDVIRAGEDAQIARDLDAELNGRNAVAAMFGQNNILRNINRENDIPTLFGQLQNVNPDNNPDPDNIEIFNAIWDRIIILERGAVDAINDIPTLITRYGNYVVLFEAARGSVRLLYNTLLPLVLTRLRTLMTEKVDETDDKNELNRLIIESKRKRDNPATPEERNCREVYIHYFIILYPKLYRIIIRETYAISNVYDIYNYIRENISIIDVIFGSKKFVMQLVQVLFRGNINVDKEMIEFYLEKWREEADGTSIKEILGYFKFSLSKRFAKQTIAKSRNIYDIDKLEDYMNDVIKEYEEEKEPFLQNTLRECIDKIQTRIKYLLTESVNRINNRVEIESRLQTLYLQHSKTQNEFIKKLLRIKIYVYKNRLKNI